MGSRSTTAMHATSARRQRKRKPRLFVWSWGQQGWKKDCLNDETYQPQFLVCLPLAQRDSLPHALFGWSLLPVLAILLTNPSSPKCFCLLKCVQNSCHCCRWASTTGTKAARTASCTRGTRSTSRQTTGGLKMASTEHFFTAYYIDLSPLSVIRLTGRLMDTSNLLTEAEKQVKKKLDHAFCIF